MGSEAEIDGDDDMTTEMTTGEVENLDDIATAGGADAYAAAKLEELSKGSGPVEVTLPRTGAADVRFTGWKIAKTSDKVGNHLRWNEANLYLTKSGTLVCQEINISCIQGEGRRSSVHVAGGADELVAAMGGELLATRVYDEAGITAPKQA